jgi:spore coat protein CotF
MANEQKQQNDKHKPPMPRSTQQATNQPTQDSSQSNPPVAKTRKARKPVPENESKADKFRRLGNARLKKACKATRQLVSLSNTSQYEFRPDQVEAILSALTAAVNAVRQSFQGKQKQDEKDIL